MRKIFLLAFSWSLIFVSNVFGQMTVQVNGPSSVQTNSQILFTVSFYNNGNQTVPPTGGTSYWDYTGAILVDESDSELRLNFTTPGQQMVYYGYSTYNDYFYDYLYLDVLGSTCDNLIPSGVGASREGSGEVTLNAGTAPSGFSYVWYGSDQTTVVSTLQSFTTPSLEKSTTYYLGYKRNTTNCVTALVPIKAQIIIYNSVKKYTARVPGISKNDVISGSISSSYKTFNYFDALGRPVQTIMKQGTISAKDLITPFEYDQFGRQVKEYLPYFETSGTQDGRFRSNGLTMHTSRTGPIYGDTYGYSEKQFEPSPLNRVTRQAAPGAAWRLGTGKEQKFSRRPNVTGTSGDSVRVFSVNASGFPVPGPLYAANTLWVETVRDEDDKTTVEYTDRLDRVILKKVQNTAAAGYKGHGGWLCTYYVYDDPGQLRVVIPPRAVELIAAAGWVSATSTDSGLAREQYFMYRYDGRGRLVEKNVPGKGKESMLYDKQDRLVGVQDGNLRDKNQWLYTKYDALGRVVMTGKTTDSSTRETLQTTLDGSGGNNAKVNPATGNIKSGSSIISSKYDGYKEYVASGSITLQDGFSMKATGNQGFTARIGPLPASGSAGAWPADEGEILTVNYYDSYALLTGHSYIRPPSPYSAGFDGQVTARVHGLQTGKKVKNLETGEFYTTAIYYDNKGRVIQTVSGQQMGGVLRSSTAYNFEDQPTKTLVETTAPAGLKIYRTFDYHVTGALRRVNHGINTAATRVLAEYTYNDLGQQIQKHFPGVSSGAAQKYAYNIRGWLTALGSDMAGVYRQNLYYQSTAAHPRFNGNIAKISWTGGQEAPAVTRAYDYVYDNANRITAATFSGDAPENFSLSEITYDGNGNIRTMKRSNQRTATAWAEVDNLVYSYLVDGNRLAQVKDNSTVLGYLSKDFKERSATAYGYDLNGNLKSNLDKQITLISYNHLNLPEEIRFTTGARITFAYDAEGNKLTQKVYNTGGALTGTRNYLGEMVYSDGNLDYLVHEEGRVALEGNNLNYEYYVKDHLGNIRQVLRHPSTVGLMATMETQNAEAEEVGFSMVSASRQTGPEHNVTAGGSKVAWLNAGRGRMVGPGRTQEIYAGDSLKLRVHGKYLGDKRQKANAAGFMASGGRQRLVSDLNELASSTRRAGGANPVALFNLADIVAKDLQKKESPEAYLMYALYDRDSNRYEVGKKVLSRNAANQHEVLEEEMYIARDGYMETFVVNETSEDVWFDNMAVMSVSSAIVQETHYDPWGLELTGLGFQHGSIKANRYLYNGKELIEDLNLGLYDYGVRYYDPAIGRWIGIDKLADDAMQVDKSPYQYGWNNPINLTDPDGNCPWCIGAVVGALVDVAIQTVEISLDDSKTIDDFSFASVGVSALAGATGVGLATKLKKVGTVGKLVIEAASDAAGSAGTQLVKEGEVDVGDVVIDVIGGQAAGKIAGDFAESKFLQSNKGKRLQEGINQQKNAERGKSNTISKSKADVKGAESKLTQAAAARAVGASTAASGTTSTAISEIDKKLNDEKKE